MSRRGAPLPVAALVASTLLLGCAQTVTVKVSGPHSTARFAGTALGEVPAAGTDVEVPPDLSAVPYEVRLGDAVVQGTVARTEPQLGLLALGVAGVACCVPSALAVGFCLANPGLLAAVPAAAVGLGDVGALTASCVAPSWATLPMLSGCGALGMAPALLALVADAPPAVVVLPAPAALPAVDPPAAPVAPVVGMAW